jgi:hypothetical protein
MSQEECARIREGVHYVKVHRYNPKHLYPKLNGYGDDDQRKVWSSGGSTHCFLSADKSYRSPSFSVVSNYDSSTHASELNCKHCGGIVNGYVSVGIHVLCIVLGTLRTTMT